MNKARVQKDTRLIKREIALRINLKKEKNLRKKLKKNECTFGQMD